MQFLCITSVIVLSGNEDMIQIFVIGQFYLDIKDRDIGVQLIDGCHFLMSDRCVLSLFYSVMGYLY